MRLKLVNGLGPIREWVKKEVAKQPNHTTETFQYVATPLHVLT